MTYKAKATQTINKYFYVIADSKDEALKSCICVKNRRMRNRLHGGEREDK